MGILDAPSPTLTTQRVTADFGSGGVAITVDGAVREWVQRTVLVLPVDTKRWRLRIRNCRVRSGAVGTGIITCTTGVYVGVPLYAGTGRWEGGLVASPTLALPTFATPADLSEVTTSWVTNANQQFTAHAPLSLSLGFTAPATNTFPYDFTQRSLYLAGAGTSALASSSSALTSPQSLVTLDMRLEYEYTTAIGSPSSFVTLDIGDSITAGFNGGDSGTYTHEAWPGVAALRTGQPSINWGIGSETLAGMAVNLAAWKWTRCDLATTVPAKARIALGSNDAVADTALATMQADFVTIATNLRNLGIKNIEACTIIPRGFTGAQETTRTDFNNWLRGLPSGVTRCHDFDKALAVEAAPSTINADYASSYPHLLRGGYQRMGTIVA